MGGGGFEGLCGSCRRLRRVSGRGSAGYLLCTRALTDRRYPKYPRIPLASCPGYEEKLEMERYLVLTVIGDDRPGIVEQLSETISSKGGNWLESRMAQLAGKFAGILRVAVAGDRLDELQQALAALSDVGLTVSSEAGEVGQPPRLSASLELVGSDQPGIVRDIAAILARHDVNVRELETACLDAPMSGQPLFKAVAELHLPDGLEVDRLRSELEALASDLMVEIQISELNR